MKRTRRPRWPWHRWFLLEHPDARKTVPAPPPPTAPARSPWTDPPWKGKVIYFTWGLENGQFTPDTLADLAARCHARAASIEITPGNLAMHGDVKAKLHARGIAYLVWERSDQKTAGEAAAEVLQLQPDGYLADVEGPMHDPSFAATFAHLFPSLPRSLCATGALDNSIPGGPAAASAPWIAAGWDLAMQDYTVENPNATVAGDDNYALWRGWPPTATGHRHWPVLEVEAEGSKPFAEQLPDVDGYRDEHNRLCVGIYPAENLTGADITAIAAS